MTPGNKADADEPFGSPTHFNLGGEGTLQERQMPKATVIAIAASLFAAGCGPMISPLTVRLDADQQKMVDGMWNNMLTPTDRLDRELLLDVLCQSWLFQIGVDRLHLTSEKGYDR